MKVRTVPGAHARPKTSDLRRSLRLFRRFKGSGKVYVVGIALLAFEAATAVVEPYPIAYLVDFLQGARPALAELGLPSLLGSPRWDTILLLTLAILLIAAINSAADSFAEVCMARGGRTLGYNTRVAMYSHLQRLPLAYHDKKRTGDVLTRVTGDVLVVEEFVVSSISNIIGSLLVLLGSFAILLTQSWNVALVALAVVPMLGFISNLYSRRIKKASKTQRSREGELASTAQEMLTSIRLVQSYGRGAVDLGKFSDQTEQSMRASLRTANVQAEFSFVIALVEAAAIAAVVWIGVFLLDRSAITVGTLVLFILLLQNMFKPARKIVSEWYKIGKVFASVERIDDLLDREVDVQDAPDAVPAPPLTGRLTFRHVGFTYPAEHVDGKPAERRPQVLRDVDFEVAPGEVVALVGQSGAGKSTIAALVPRLYDPDTGAVLLDGHDVRGLTLASVRSQVSLVLQDTVLLSGTVAENIGYGVEDPSPERIEEAARAANAHNFIMELPDGYQTQLAERATTLSGGQRQRLAIARAFIRHTPILILDEPTTGLDAESTQLVIGALRSLMRDKTTIIVSHDPELIGCADRVLTVVDGVVVDSQAGAKRPATTGAHRARRARPPVPAALPVPRQPARLPADLREPLHATLPGLRQATDPEFAAEQVRRLLLPANGDLQLHDARVEKLWYRLDGTCSLRYVVRVEDAARGAAEHTVLARVHADDSAAWSYLADGVGQLAQAGADVVADGPWRSTGAVVPGTGLALHPYPLDPGLATLVRAANPRSIGGVLRQLAGNGGHHDPRWSVHVVHHPREGSCVLRYDRDPADGPVDGPTSVYGKVYSDGGGQITVTTLRALQPGTGSPNGHDRPRVPRPLGYVPSLRLLLTEALPGEPELRRLLRAGSPTWTAAAGTNGAGTNGAGTNGAGGTDVPGAVAAAGRVLAALHRTSRPQARAYRLGAELDLLRGEADALRPTWPDVAELLQPHLAEITRRARALPEPDLVVSHGDFTPSQLLGGPDEMALVDLDTLCRADRALDLGRFLAHLQLSGLKAAGDAAWPLLDALAGAFLHGYAAAATPPQQVDGALLDRVAVYRDASLLRTALRSCRQLKDARLSVALAALDHGDDWIRRIG